MKRVIAAMMVLCLLLPTLYAGAAESQDYTEQLEAALEYIQENVPNPTVASSRGDWAVFALAGCGAENDELYYKYYQNVKKYVSDKGSGIISDSKSTDNSRVVIGLSSIGRAADDVCGYDLTEPLKDYEYVTGQGVNSTSYAMIALQCFEDAVGSDNPEETAAVKERYLQYIIDNQLPSGGWAMSGVYADVDMTAMALQAIAPYYGTDDSVKAAAESALDALSAMQRDNGGFLSLGLATSEGCAQVLCAMASLGISCDDERFVKNGNTVLDALLSYYDGQSGGFRHIENLNVSQMSTEQAVYALDAYYRYQNGMNSIFDMTGTTVKGVKNVTVEIDDGNVTSNLQTDISQINKGEIRLSDLFLYLNENDAADIEFGGGITSVNGITNQTGYEWVCLIDGVTAENADELITYGCEKVVLKYSAASDIDSDTDSNTDSDSGQLEGDDESFGEPDSLMSVQFRLIGATLSDGDIDLGSGGYNGSEYVTWISTTEFELSEGAAVQTLIIHALSSFGFDSSGAGKDYVESLTAPAECGMYELSEFTNGRCSGWMYSINGSHFSISISDMTLNDGDSVVLHYVNDYRYEIPDWKDSSGNASLGDGEYYEKWLEADDVMPSFDNFEQEEVPETDADNDTTADSDTASDTDTDSNEDSQQPASSDVNETEKTERKSPFSDVSEKDWYYEAVMFAYEKNLMKGTGSTVFSPNDAMTREMVMAVIYRMEGEPESSGAAAYSDFDSESWSADAVSWATENQIVFGYADGRIGAGDSVTRRQLITMLHRYAGFKEYVTTDELREADSVDWAVSSGLIIGFGDNDMSLDTGADRAQVSQIIMRFCMMYMSR